MNNVPYLLTIAIFLVCIKKFELANMEKFYIFILSSGCNKYMKNIYISVISIRFY